MWFKSKKENLLEMINQEDASFNPFYILHKFNLEDVLNKREEKRKLIADLEDDILDLQNKLDDENKSFDDLGQILKTHIIANCPLVMTKVDWSDLVAKREIQIGDKTVGIYYYKTMYGVESVLGG